MLVLGINTATPLQSVALLHNGKTLLKKSWHGKWDESSTVLPNITSLLRSARKSFQDLDTIVVVRGPGSFSSVRIGVTIANTLAYALGIPVYGIKTNIDFPRRIKHSKKRITDFVTPFYSKPPNITLSKKNFP